MNGKVKQLYIMPDGAVRAYNDEGTLVSAESGSLVTTCITNKIDRGIVTDDTVIILPVKWALNGKCEVTVRDYKEACGIGLPEASVNANSA